MSWWKQSQLDKEAGLIEWIGKMTSKPISRALIAALISSGLINEFVNSLKAAPSQQQRDSIVEQAQQDPRLEEDFVDEKGTDWSRWPEVRPSTEEEASEVLPFPRETKTEPIAPSAEPSTGINIEAWVDRIIRQESAGNPRAVSNKGAGGLIQIMPATWTEMTKEVFGRPLPQSDRFDPQKNKRIGVAYLSKVKDILRKGLGQEPTIEQVLAAYNGGPYRLIKYKGNVSRMPAESRDYVQKITGR